MLSVSSSSLSSFPPLYLLCLHSCRQWDCRGTDSPSSSLFPVFQRSSSCFFLLWCFAAIRVPAVGRSTQSGTLAGPLWLRWTMSAWEIWASNYSTCSSDVLPIPVNTKGTLPSLCRNDAFCFSPLTQSLTMPELNPNLLHSSDNHSANKIPVKRFFKSSYCAACLGCIYG